ncbi:MAG TPA: hypothetical protein VHM24_03270, partial [Gemmatimonadaceae bacterium]|nr:hypothetical protein [Gemmatimonadaceae bacterium]
MVWSAAGAPRIARVLGFDPDDGLVAFVDEKGQPRRIDLRASEVRFASKAKLSSIATANGSEIYGISEKGVVARMTPTGDWRFQPPYAARWVFPQPNGSVVVAGSVAGKTQLWLIRPPDEEIIETAALPVIHRGVQTQVGDRLYFTVDSGLIGVKTRDLALLKPIRLSEPVAAIVPTPSGDRLYVALKGRNALAVVNRYSEELSGDVALPGPAAELRMDPLGQFILARPAGLGDSAWVVTVRTNKLQGAVRSEWRNDLPAFAPGSTIATVQGSNVVLVSSQTMTPSRTVSSGAKDFWYFFAWNGFRPRAADLDRPVTFDSGVSARAGDSALPGLDTAVNPPLRDATPSMIEPPATIPPAPPPRPPGYMVSFAAVLTEQKAADAAAA